MANIDIQWFAGALGLLSPDQNNEYPPEQDPDLGRQHEEPPST